MSCKRFDNSHELKLMNVQWLNFHFFVRLFNNGLLVLDALQSLVRLYVGWCCLCSYAYHTVLITPIRQNCLANNYWLLTTIFENDQVTIANVLYIHVAGRSCSTYSLSTAHFRWRVGHLVRFCKNFSSCLYPACLHVIDFDFWSWIFLNICIVIIAIYYLMKVQGSNQIAVKLNYVIFVLFRDSLLSVGRQPVEAPKPRGIYHVFDQLNDMIKT